MFMTNAATSDDRRARLDALHARSLAAAKNALDRERHLIPMPAADDPARPTYRQAASLPLAYALLAENDPVSLAEGTAIVAFQSGPNLEQVWINDVPVDLSQSGQTLTHDEWLVVVDGDVSWGCDLWRRQP